MRERIEAIGGRLQVESELDVGTMLTVRVPLPSERNDG
jgi:signal transduction histidine kinase